MVSYRISLRPQTLRRTTLTAVKAMSLFSWIKKKNVFDAVDHEILLFKRLRHIWVSYFDDIIAPKVDPSIIL